MRLALLAPFLFPLAALAQVSTYAVFTNLVPPVQPPDRDSSQMAWDEARGRMLVAGGRAPGAEASCQHWLGEEQARSRAKRNPQYASYNKRYRRSTAGSQE